MTTDLSSPENFLPRDGLSQLIETLRLDGCKVVGPTLDQGAIVYSEIRSINDLPSGWTETQAPGQYRLERRSDDAYFGYTVGPHSWKKYLFPPLATVSRAVRTPDGWSMSDGPADSTKHAFLGVRACELAAIAVQDRTFLHGEYVDPIYKARRDQTLIIAVNCTQAASTCFCTSMGTGPRCTQGFDLALTELSDGFLVEIGSPAGESLAARLPLISVTEKHSQEGETRRQNAVHQIQRRMDTEGLRDLLLENLEHPRWTELAQRCLSCTNCTMVCPTCFCHSVRDVSDLTGDSVTRERQWDSCFNVDFSYMNGGPVRNDVRSRYRQWLTHKLASWVDQFGVSGCVGCGRCITWCPVGIDLTEEVAAIRASDGREPLPAPAEVK